MKLGQASGTQIAFFTFAVLLLAVPLTEYLAKFGVSSSQDRRALSQTVIFGFGALVIFGIPPLRKRALELLRAPIPRDRWVEVAVVTLSKACLFALAITGALALWHWHREGFDRLSRLLSAQPVHSAELTRSLSPLLALHYVLVVGCVGPILEEIVFRGFLYRTWEKRWGWASAMLLNSALFGIYHAAYVSAFVAGLIYTALYRRTGSLWAPIAVHSIYNVLLWYPLLGQIVFPKNSEAHTSLSGWSLQIAALGIVLLAVPVYLWLARKPHRPIAPSPPLV